MKIKLDRDKIKEYIYENYGGGTGRYGWAYYLIVRPNGDHRIAALDERPWIYDDDYAARLPAPRGDGRSEWGELMAEFCEDNGIEVASGQTLRDAIEHAGMEEEWGYWEQESLDWYAAEWLAALNGEPNDLQIEAPFGRFWAGREYLAVKCPHRFEWK